MDNEDIYTYIGTGFGVVIIISVFFLILMCWYIRRRKASQLQDETESQQRPASEKVLIGKADQGEITTRKTETSPQNGSVGNPQNTPDATPFMTQNYEEVDIGGFPNQQENGLVDATSPPNDNADMTEDAATTSSQNEGASINDGTHLMEENNMYVSADEVKLNKRNPDKVDDISDEVFPPNEDDVEGDSVASPSQNEDANTNDNSHMEENKMYVSADEVRLNKKPSVIHYTAESGDIYAGIVKS